MRLIVIKLYTMYNFLKIKNNSKLLHIYFPLFLVEHSARVSRFLKHIKEKEKPTYQFSFKVSEN